MGLWYIIDLSIRQTHIDQKRKGVVFIMLDNVKFKGISFRPHLSDQKVYINSKDIDHLEYVDLDTEDC